jgi:N-acetylmuramate 1-kinase
MLREKQIIDFLIKSNIKNYSISKIPNDASFRNYYRISFSDKASIILMDAPPKHEDVRPFIKIAKFLISHNLSAPKIIANDNENGFLLLEDFGNLSYNKALKNQNPMDLPVKELDLYKKACDVLVDLHKIKEIPDHIPLYDAELLLKEVMLFIDWYLPHILKKSASEEQITVFKMEWLNLFKQLNDNKKLVLRDYHADNLMLLKNREVGLLDFQDAVIGSAAYDLVSLLEDARRDVDKNTVNKILEYYIKNSNCNQDKLLIDYQILSLQRNIKIIGIFSRLAIRDNKKNYLNFLPKIINYVIIRFEDEIFSNLKGIFNNFDLKWE